MITAEEENIDEVTVNQVGLKISGQHINAHNATDARVFEYPHLENVFIMESDLYGNRMPKGSCFLAFYGTHGLIGKHLSVKTLREASLQDMKELVACNTEG